MAGAGLQRLAVVHQRLNGVSCLRTGELFLLRLLPLDHRDRQHFFTEIRIDVQHPYGPFLCLLCGRMGRVAFLPEKFPGAQEGSCGLLPAHDGAPLIVVLRQIPVGMDLIGIEITEQRLRSRTHAHALLQRLQSSVRHPCHLRRKSLHMVFLLLKQALRDKHGQIYVLHPGFLKSPVQLLLDIFPDGIACRLDDHTALYTRIIDQFRFLHHICIPLGKVHIHGGDALHQLLFFCHIHSPYIKYDPKLIFIVKRIGRFVNCLLQFFSSGYRTQISCEKKYEQYR